MRSGGEGRRVGGKESLIRGNRIHALIETPRLDNGEVNLVQFIEYNVKGVDSPLEDTGVSDVEVVALVLQHLSSQVCLLHSLILLVNT